VPYLALAVPVLPSLAIGAVAFGAGELIFRSKDNSDLKTSNKPLYETLIEAKEKNKQIANMIPKIENIKMRENIKEINISVEKIIKTIEKKPEKFSKMHNFFDYYLPITLTILNKYDEIENQSLTSEESMKFMAQTQEMMEKINKAFKGQLSNLYQADIIDTDAEMKVFESMLKIDGYDNTSDFHGKE